MNKQQQQEWPEYQLRIHVWFGPTEMIRQPGGRKPSHRVYRGAWIGEGTTVYHLAKPPKEGKGKNRRTVQLIEHMVGFARHYVTLAIADALKAGADRGLPLDAEIPPYETSEHSP